MAWKEYFPFHYLDLYHCFYTNFVCLFVRVHALFQGKYFCNQAVSSILMLALQWLHGNSVYKLSARIVMVHWSIQHCILLKYHRWDASERSMDEEYIKLTLHHVLTYSSGNIIHSHFIYGSPYGFVISVPQAEITQIPAMTKNSMVGQKSQC